MKEVSFFEGFGTTVFAEGFLWGFMHSHNVLAQIDITTGKMKYVSRVPEEGDFESLYIDIVYREGKLFLIPLRADSIAMYDIEENRFHKIEINIKRCIKNSSIYKFQYKCSKGLVYDNYLYIFPCCFSAIIRMDLNDYSLDYIDDWAEEINPKVKNRNEVYFRSFFFDGDKNVWLAGCAGNYIMKFDLSSNCHMVFEVGSTENCFSDMYITSDNQIWLSSKKREKLMLLTDILQNDYQYIERTENNSAQGLYGYGNKLLLVPYFEGDFIFIDRQKRVVFDCKELEEILDRHQGAYCSVYENNKLYFIPHGDLRLIIYSISNNCFEQICLAPDEVMCTYVNRIKLENTVMENGKFNLDIFLCGVMMEDSSSLMQNATLTGNIIYNKCKNDF